MDLTRTARNIKKQSLIEASINYPIESMVFKEALPYPGMEQSE
jgi:hypothetical protein